MTKLLTLNHVEINEKQMLQLKDDRISILSVLFNCQTLCPVNLDYYEIILVYLADYRASTWMLLIYSVQCMYCLVILHGKCRLYMQK